MYGFIYNNNNASIHISIERTINTMGSSRMYSSVKKMDKSSITLKEKEAETVIFFSDCVSNYRKTTGRSNSNCIAFRDINENKFVFFTQPLTILQLRKKRWFNIFWKQKTNSEFVNIQKKIEEYGYCSYDLS